uniref:Myb/SANT-like domain-containing protein n=1 Tax=Gossypium raimondii TaxID=29730 RepID=A0A0D2UTJ9_GOSRA|nr:hypothetical protein B456_011G134900 [Gossypium raimondii]
MKYSDIFIKEILKGNRPGTHFTKEGWLKITVIFENETDNAYSKRQFKNRWDALKKEWKAWKKLKGEDTDLGATNNMSQVTFSLTPIIDPYGIPQAIKVLDSLSEEVLEASLLYFFSMKLLINKDKRIVFLSTNPNIRAWWLKMEMKESSKFCSLLGIEISTMRLINAIHV